MDIFRKAMLAVGTVSFAICGLFLNLMGGIAMCMNDFSECGKCLIISVCLFGVSLVAAFFKNRYANIISIVFNIAATSFYIYPLGILNGIDNSVIPAQSIELFTGRIYPSVIITLSLALGVAADVFSYDRMSARAERKKKKLEENTRSLKDNEKIV